MEFIDYLVQNAKAIMMLCFGGGFLILAIQLARAASAVIKLVKKINNLLEIFVDYIQKPLAVILSAKKIFDQIVDRFTK